MEFTFHAPHGSGLTIGKEAHNALVTDGEARILVFGNELNEKEREALTAAFATDGGTVVLSADAEVSKVRANVGYVIGKAKRKPRFAKVTANTPDAPIIGYVVTLTQ